MMKASLKGRYDVDKGAVAVAVTATLAVNAAVVNLRASMTDATSLSGLSLSLEKPGSFIIDYDVPKKDVWFQFMNTVRVLEKPLSLTYTHGRGENLTMLDGTLVFDPANKVSANYAFDSSNCKLKCSYVHGGVRMFEPCYDLARNSWGFAVSQKVRGDDVLTC